MASPASAPVSAPPELPWWDAWRLTAPAAATGWLLLFTTAWQYRPGAASYVVLGLAAWCVALCTELHARRPLADRWLRVGVAAVAGAAAVIIALTHVPRAAVEMAVPVFFLAGFQTFVSLGRGSPAAAKIALVFAGAGAGFVLLLVPGAWPPVLRFGLLALVAVGIVSALRQGDGLHFSESSLGVARGATFVAGVLVPFAWMSPRGLVYELQRTENLAFVALAVLVAVGTALARPLAGRERNAAWPLSLMLPLAALLCLGTWWLVATTDHVPTRQVFIAVAAAASVLTVIIPLAHSLGRGLAIALELPLLLVWALVPWLSRWATF